MNLLATAVQKNWRQRCSGAIVPFLIATISNSNGTNVTSLFLPYLTYRLIIFGNRRDKYTIHSKAVVCQDVELKGDITIGSGLA